MLSACAEGIASLEDASISPVAVLDGGGGSAGENKPDRDATAADSMAADSMEAGSPGTGGTDDSGASGDPGTKSDAGPVPVPDASVTPVDPCVELCRDDRSKDAKSCASPVTIGRKSALTDSFVYNGDTRGAGDKQDLNFIDCSDENADNFFRVFLYKDDVITIRLSATEYDPVVTLVTGPSCEVVESAACADDGLAGDNEVLKVLAPNDGWYHVVADGPYDPTVLEGQGRYTLAVGVVSTSSAGKCMCP